MNDLSERLARCEIVILDGAISTEIQRCGVAFDAISWASRATLKCPDSTRISQMTDLPDAGPVRIPVQESEP